MHRPFVWLALVAATAALALWIPASASASQRAYLAEYSSAAQIPVFNIGPDGGLVTPSPFTNATAGLNGDLEAVTLSPDGDSLFTGDSDGLFSLPVNTATGQLGTAIPTATTDSGYGLVVTPDGKFIYQGEEGGPSIAGFNLAPDGTIGAPVPGSPLTPADTPEGLAVTTDGKYLYSANIESTVGAYAIGSNGALTELPGSPYPSADSPYAISLSPDGKHLYVPGRNTGSQQVFSYDIAADGSLTQTPGSPVNMSGGAGNSFGSTVTGDGKFFFTANYATGNISGFKINADGSLTELTGSPFALAGQPSSVTSDFDGSHIYVANDTNPTVEVLALDSAGAPTPVTGSPFAVGVTGDFQAIALSPVQPPVARIGIVDSVGRTLTFDASASTDPDGGTITSYAWDFGDGTKTTTTTPKTTHDYGFGSFTASVTETDSDGCSTTYTSSGQTAFCAGNPGARASVNVKFTDKPSLKVDAKSKQKLGKPLKLNVTSEPGVTITAGKVKAKLKGADAKSVTYKGASLTIPASGTGKLKLKLSGKSAKVAKGAKSGKAKVKLTADGEGGETTSTFKVKLK